MNNRNDLRKLDPKVVDGNENDIFVDPRYTRLSDVKSRLLAVAAKVDSSIQISAFC
jgi:hypothetical protein